MYLVLFLWALLISVPLVERYLGLKPKYVVVSFEGMEVRLPEEVPNDSMKTGLYYIKYTPSLKFKEVVAAQLLHETDSLKSNISKECKNDYGMKVNSRGLHIGRCRGHAGYSSHYNSFKDYLEWQTKYLPLYESRYNVRVRSDEDYLTFLYKQQYAEDKNYLEKLRYWIPKAKKILKDI